MAIETAKKLGYYTVLCDYLSDNPGQFSADKFYQVSTTDKATVLEVAESEGVDGVLAYASDPAAPTAAFVAEKMGLLTNPYKSVEILCNKDKFRGFLKENGFNVPRAEGFASKDEAVKAVGEFQFPVIVKPVDSSGSKGATVLQSADGIEAAVDFALSYSRCGRVILEEFMEKKHQYLIGGDIFVIDGKIVMWGLMNCHRDSNVNPLVPVGKSYPLKLCKSDEERVKNTLRDMTEKLNICSGALNVELVIDKNDRVFPIDIGPRSGGNMIPDLLGYIFKADVVDMSVRAAMGERLDSNIKTAEPSYYATHNLHTSENGVFRGIRFSDELEKYIVRKSIYKKSGDRVSYFNNSADVLGIIFMKFPDESEMDSILNNINSHITVDVE